MLNKSLTEIRSGNLSAAVHALTQLVGLNPKEPRYRELLERTRSQLEFENWYRFSQRNDPEDLPEVAEAMGEAGKSPAEAREQFLIWVNSIHWDRR